MAAALGWVVGAPEKGLLLLDEVSEQQIGKAQEIVAQGRVQFDILMQAEGIHVEATVKTDQGEGKALIAGRHDHLKALWLDQRLVGEEEQDRKESSSHLGGPVPGMDTMIKMIDNIDTEKLDFLDQGFALNMEAAKVGLSLTQDGFGLGRRLRSLLGKMKQRTVCSARYG